jgi:hypothetical protein
MNDTRNARALRVGDDIVITLPLEWIEKLITSPEFERSEACEGVEIIDRVKFADELVANMNGTNALEELAIVEVGALIESRSDALTATRDTPKVKFG